MARPTVSVNEAAPSPTIMKRKTTATTVTFASAMLIATLVSASAGDAKETWGKSCAKCHGANGDGQTMMGKKLKMKDYTDAKVQATFTDEAAFKAIKDGVKKDDKTLMKAAEGLTDPEITALVKQVRSLKK